ncbi:TPM domain-containing protein [Glycomyces sp. A-F 0318]|uniref:TPM domain-containing protein n=1 Tax=Glycomyces amatae TaxID=2881355 RepID=UPI001E52D6EA|nr:TPM domain-containing protein [Glycomyces amatae]
MRTSLAVLAAAALALVPGPASAAAPLLLSGPVTDRAGAVGDREDDVLAAIGDLEEDTGMGLYVAYIDDFGGYDPQDWADTTAVDSDLGTDDLLLAVAIDERRYTWSVAAGFPLTDSQLNRVAADRIAPELADGNWVEAAIGAAEGYRAAYRGEGASGGSSFVWILVLLLAAAAAIGLYLWFRNRRRGGGAAAPVPSPAKRQKMTTERLNAEANRLLVETDDAIRTSEQELGFAEAEFGAEHTAAFTAALAAARTGLTESFKIRQELDDDVPETEPQRRQMLSAIVDRLVEANRELDAKADDFDRLRDLGRRAPEAVAALKERGGALPPRIAEARAALTSLQDRYAESASATVRDFPDTAEDRLRFAQTSLNGADQAVAADDRGRAALLLRAAEEATAQAEQAVDAVARRSGELDAAAAQLGAVLDEAEANAGEAGRAAAGAPDGEAVAAQAAHLEAVVAEVRAAEGPVDPLAATARVERAAAELDRGLEALRGAVAGARRARAQLDQVLLSARSTTAAVEDYVNTNRGAVGPEARTRLNEARIQLDRALALQEDDPARALPLAQRADELANAAAAAAQQDVQGYLAPTYTGGGGSPLGGSAGAMLGGILLGGMFGGGGGGGAYRPGGFAGGGRRRSAGPGSFGGSATRGRRGGGGRF